MSRSYANNKDLSESLFSRLFNKSIRVTCFYCGTETLLTRQGPENQWRWHCQNCDSLNLRDQNGEIVDERPEMFNSSLNKVINGARSSSSFGHGIMQSSKNIFCKDCQLNQTLVVQLLSSYIPPDDDPEFDYYHATAEEYRRAIEERYPLMCDECQIKVDLELKRQNFQVKTKAFNHRLLSSDKTRIEKIPRLNSLTVCFWFIRGAAWTALNLLMSLFYLYGYFWPEYFHFVAAKEAQFDADFSEISQSTFSHNFLGALRFTASCLYLSFTDFPSPTCTLHLYKTLPYLCVLSIFWAFWDPTWLKRMRNIKRRVIGREEYLYAQTVLFLLRLTSIFFLKMNWSTRTFASLNAMFFGLSSAAILYSLFIIQIREPISLTLKETGRKVNMAVNEGVMDTNNQESRSRRNELPFENLVLSRPASGDRIAELRFGDQTTTKRGSINRSQSMDSSSAFQLLNSSPSAPLQRSSSAQETFGSRVGLDNKAGLFGWSSAGSSTSRSEVHHRRSKSSDIDGTERDEEMEELITRFEDQRKKVNENTDWNLAPQRFFAPQKPTGLEDIFSAGFKIQDESVLVQSIKLLNQKLYGQGTVAKRVILLASVVRMFVLLLVPLQILYIGLIGFALTLLREYESTLLEGNAKLKEGQSRQNMQTSALNSVMQRGSIRQQGQKARKAVGKDHLFSTRILIYFIACRILLSFINLTWIIHKDSKIHHILSFPFYEDWSYLWVVAIDVFSQDWLALPFFFGTGTVWKRVGGVAVDLGVCLLGGIVWQSRWQRPRI